jgi:hypothetical protein
MGHLLDRCDIIDLLEEAALSGRAVTVELRGDRRFVDQVRDVVTRDGDDFALFENHQSIPVGDIHFCARAEPPG